MERVHLSAGAHRVDKGGGGGGGGKLAKDVLSMRQEVSELHYAKGL